MNRELRPLEVSQSPEVLHLAEEVQQTGRPRRLLRNGVAIATLVPAQRQPTLADPDDIWAGYDVERVQQALRESAGALAGVDRDELVRDIYAQRGQDSAGRPA